MADLEPIAIRESTQALISGYRVGVSNIWERDVADADGVIASRLTAQVTLTDPGLDQSRRLDVAVGSVLFLGDDRYRVVNVVEGISAPGAIALQPLSDTE
jgi:hypothetical protein